MNQKLTVTQRQLLAYMREHGGAIHYHRGGYWAREGFQPSPHPGQSETYFNKQSLWSLEKRGLIRFTDTKTTYGGGQYYVKAELTEAANGYQS